MTKEVENQLEYVKRGVAKIEKGQIQSTALAAQVPIRTMHHMKRANFDPRYSTVLKLYTYLKASEPKPARAKVVK